VVEHDITLRMLQMLVEAHAMPAFAKDAGECRLANLDRLPPHVGAVPTFDLIGLVTADDCLGSGSAKNCDRIACPICECPASGGESAGCSYVDSDVICIGVAGDLDRG